MTQAAEIIGTGLIGAGVGIGVAFGALILGVARNPSIRGQLFSGFAFAGATGMFILVELILRSNTHCEVWIRSNSLFISLLGVMFCIVWSALGFIYLVNTISNFKSNKDYSKLFLQNNYDWNLKNLKVNYKILLVVFLCLAFSILLYLYKVYIIKFVFEYIAYLYDLLIIFVIDMKTGLFEYPLLNIYITALLLLFVIMPMIGLIIGRLTKKSQHWWFFFVKLVFFLMSGLLYPIWSRNHLGMKTIRHNLNNKKNIRFFIVISFFLLLLISGTSLGTFYLDTTVFVYKYERLFFFSYDKPIKVGDIVLFVLAMISLISLFSSSSNISSIFALFYTTNFFGFFLPDKTFLALGKKNEGNVYSVFGCMNITTFNLYKTHDTKIYYYVYAFASILQVFILIIWEVRFIIFSLILTMFMFYMIYHMGHSLDSYTFDSLWSNALESRTNSINLLLNLYQWTKDTLFTLPKSN